MNIYAFADEASPKIDEQIKALLENNLDGIEIRNADDVNVSDISIDKAKEVKQKFDASGLKVWSVGSPIGKIDIEKDNFEKHLEKLKSTLETANILGAENIRLFSFYIPEGKNPDGYYNEVINRVGTMAEMCVKAGVYPCHENEKGIYGDIAERCARLYEEIPLLYGVFDPANFVQCGEDVSKAWKMLNPFIKYLHIKDAQASGNVVPAGKGIGNIKSILTDFFERGGNAITVEPHLSVFSGLDKLENGNAHDKVGKEFTYPDNRTAFDVAVNAVKELMR